MDAARVPLDLWTSEAQQSLQLQKCLLAQTENISSGVERDGGGGSEWALEVEWIGVWGQGLLLTMHHTECPARPLLYVCGMGYVFVLGVYVCGGQGSTLNITPLRRQLPWCFVSF